MTFENVYKLLERKGDGKAISSRGTVYKLEARNDRIYAYPRSGNYYVCSGCWGQDITCNGSRAGGIYSGEYTIFDWYTDNM